MIPHDCSTPYGPGSFQKSTISQIKERITISKREKSDISLCSLKQTPQCNSLVLITRPISSIGDSSMRISSFRDKYILPTASILCDGYLIQYE